MSTVKRWNGTSWEHLTSTAAIGTTADIKMDGVASIGTVEALPRADHVHPTDTSREVAGTTSTHAALTTTHGVTGAVVGTTNAQTLTNKTLTAPVISSITNTGTLTLPTSTDTLVGRATTDTLTNKTINLTSNTLSGTVAQFNTSLSDGDFATLAGTETLTNKTISSPTVSGGTINNASIGATTPGTGAFTTLTTTGNTTLGDAATDTLTVGVNGLVKTAAGNVLIGTTDDDVVNKLQVNGSIATTSVKSTTTGNPTTGAGITQTQKSPTIIIPDALRAAVEAASGGKNTIIYTATGQPSYMVVVPCFNVEDIDASLGTGRHPAFVVNGVNKSEIFIGQHQGFVSNGELLSLPMKTPIVSQNFDAFRGYATANGAGWHLMSNAERAAIALWCWKNGFQPRGNNNYGRDAANMWETGRRPDAQVPGYTASGGITLTGSGPSAWSHDGTPQGIFDLNGNIWEWSSGLRLMNGEIQVLPNNDAADNNKDVSVGSALWKAIDKATGNLVAPGTAGTLKYDATGGTVVLSDTTGGTTGNRAIEGMTKSAGVATVPAIAMALGLYPVGGAASGLGGDNIWVNVSGEFVPFVGGTWTGTTNAGVFALYLSVERAHASAGVGARPAYVL